MRTYFNAHLNNLLSHKYEKALKSGTMSVMTLRIWLGQIRWRFRYAVIPYRSDLVCMTCVQGSTLYYWHFFQGDLGCAFGSRRHVIVADREHVTFKQETIWHLKTPCWHRAIGLSCFHSMNDEMQWQLPTTCDVKIICIFKINLFWYQCGDCCIRNPEYFQY